jgi:hypothetical protein
MARAMRRLTYRGKKQEYIKKDAIANILAKMAHEVKFNFDKSISRNLIEEIETEIELTIGIQEILKEGTPIP